MVASGCFAVVDCLVCGFVPWVAFVVSLLVLLSLLMILYWLFVIEAVHINDDEPLQKIFTRSKCQDTRSHIHSLFVFSNANSDSDQKDAVRINEWMNEWMNHLNQSMRSKRTTNNTLHRRIFNKLRTYFLDPLTGITDPSSRSRDEISLLHLVVLSIQHMPRRGCNCSASFRYNNCCYKRHTVV